jgi:tripartite motif-containing protein 2/3/tripartite motif-containing protein 56
MVCDFNNQRVMELFTDGRPPRVLCSGLSYWCIAKLSNGDYAVTLAGQHQVQRMDGQGRVRWTAGSTHGSGPGQFSNPWGVAVLDDGLLAVADQSNNRVQLLNAETGACVRVLQDGLGLRHPFGVSVDSRGHLYILDNGNHRIVVADRDGRLLRTLGSHGSGPGQLCGPFVVAVDGQDNVLVADHGNKRVVVFHADGTTAHFAVSANPSSVAVCSDGRVLVALAGTGVFEY